MRSNITRYLVEIILGLIVAVAVVIIVRQSRRIAEFQSRQEADAQVVRLLRQALLRKNLETLPAPVTEVIPPAAETNAAEQKEVVIERLDRDLAEAHSTIANLQSQLNTANDQSSKALASAQEQFQQQQTDWQNKLAEAQKKVDAAVQESEIARQRAEVLETDNSKLKTDAASATTRGADVARIVSNLQELESRREAYLTSILRRYRDITGEFRNMSSMLDTSRDPNTGPCSGAALSRIQFAVNSAEDDMRQVSELNARSQKLEKELRAK